MATTQIKNGFNGGSDDQLLVNPDGSINVNATGGGVASNVSIVQGGNTAIVNPDGSLSVNTVNSGTQATNLTGLTDYKTSQYTIGLTEVQLAPTPLANRSSISFKIHTSGPAEFVLFSQAPGSVAATGYRLDDGESMQLDLTGAGSIYVVGSSAGQIVYLVELA